MFEIGDKVRIIKYGHMIFVHKDDDKYKTILGLTEGFKCVDAMPELIGKEGIITEIGETFYMNTYAIEGITSKSKWYDDGQLEKI